MSQSNGDKMRTAVIFVIMSMLCVCAKKDKIDVVYSQDETRKIQEKMVESDYLVLNETYNIDVSGIFEYYDIIPKGNYLFFQFFDNEQPHMLWDKEQKKFLKIGNIGKGPGEYIFISDIVFISPSRFYALDRGLHRINIYEIKNGVVQFVDLVNLNIETGVWIDELYHEGGKIYCINFTGPKYSHQVYVLDENFELEKKFHKRKYESDAIVANSLFYRNRIVFLGPYDFQNKRCRDSFLYVYDYNGELINRFDVKEKNVRSLWIDEKGKYIFVGTENQVKIFDLYGRLIHKISKEEQFDFKKNPNLIHANRAKKHDDILFATETEDPSVLKIEIYRCVVGENG